AAAARHGLSRADVGRVLSGRTLGAEIGQYRGGNDPAPILVRSAAGEEMTPDELTTLALPTAAGGSVPLAEVAELEVDWQPAAIYHRNRSRVVTVQAQLVPGVTALDSYRAIEPTLNALELPPGVTIELGGELEESGEANAAILRQIPVGMLLLLFFLLLEFDSFRRVAIILTTVPLAAVGVVPGLILSGQPFGMMSLLGVISLIGIVVNNAIVLLDVIEQRRSDGGTVGQALAEAVERRTRPILLTMATTVAGLSPLAFSEATLWPPLAWAMISGLAASTVLTLLVVPALYRVLFDDRASGERGATRRGLASRLGFGRSRSLATATAMLVALVGGLVMADRAGAQEPPLRLDLDAAMERAASRPVARAAAAGAAAAEQAAEAERRLGRRPTVALELEGVVRDEAFSFETPIGPFQLGEADSVTAALSVSQPLFDRPQNRFRTPAAAMEARAQDDVARRTRERLRAEAAERFLDVLALDASSAATGAFVESLEARLDEMTQRVELGRALEADALKVELDLDAARLDRDRLAARRVVAVEALARAVGHDGPVVPLSAPAASSAADSVLDAAAREAIVSEALAQRADLAALEAEAKAFELRALAVQAERWPTVRAAAAYLDSSGEAFFPEEEVRATLTFAFVPFAAGTRAPRAAALEAQADSARLRADAARRDVRFEIERAVADLDIAHRTLRVRERGVDLATETARVERERSLAGRSTTNDLLAAEAALRSQRTARDLARLDIIRAEVALDLATGRPAESAPRGSAALDQRGVH
ncbi:MAG: efflux RND transporter permease subunit, partial [Acidobacteriota bacterium]